MIRTRVRLKQNIIQLQSVHLKIGKNIIVVFNLFSDSGPCENNLWSHVDLPNLRAKSYTISTNIFFLYFHKIHVYYVCNPKNYSIADFRWPRIIGYKNYCIIGSPRGMRWNLLVYGLFFSCMHSCATIIIWSAIRVHITVIWFFYRSYFTDHKLTHLWVLQLLIIN